MRDKGARVLRRPDLEIRKAPAIKVATVNARASKLRLALPMVLLVCLLPFYWVSFRAPAVGTIHDDGIYLVTAKALAEGKGYRIISLPDEPKQTKYPIGFPFLLALLWKVSPNFPGNVPLLKIVPVISLLAWLGTGILFARRWGRLSWEATLWIAFLCAGTHWAVFIGTNFMSDLLFGALALASLHFLLRMEDSARPIAAQAIAAQPIKDALLAGVLCAAAYSVRTSAVALILGGVIALATRSKWRQAAAFAAAPLCSIGLWTAWQSGERALSNPIQAYYTWQNYADWNLITASYPRMEKLAVLLGNVFYVLTYPLQVIISNGNLLPWPVALVLGCAVWWFFSKGLKATPRLRTAHLCFGIYIGLVLLWAWPLDRFLTSFLPLFAVVVHAGLPQRVRKLYWGAIPVAVLLLGGWSNMQYERASGIPWMTDDRHLSWAQLSQLHDWINNYAEPGSVVMANFDPAVYLYTGHKAIRPYALDNLGLFYGMPADPARREAMFRQQLATSQVGYVMRSSTDMEELELTRWIARMRYEGIATPVVALPGEYQIYQIQKPHQP